MPVWYSLGGGADNLKPDDIYDPSNANCKSHERKKTIGSDALLTGLIFDDRGNTMSPVKSRRRGGRFYLYYVSQARIQRRDPDGMRPVPAPAVEEIVRDRLSCIIGCPNNRPAEDQSHRPTNFRVIAPRTHSRICPAGRRWRFPSHRNLQRQRNCCSGWKLADTDRDRIARMAAGRRQF